MTPTSHSKSSIDVAGLKINGVDTGLSGAELAVLDSVSPGLAAASKAAVLGTNKELDEVHTAALYLGAGAGTLLTPTAAQVNKLAQIAATGYLQFIEAVTFTETTGAGVYTGSVNVPAGALILDVNWHNTVLWTAATSATMKAGIVADDDMFFTAVNLKAAPIADVNGAGGISSAKNDTGSGVAGGLTVYSAGAVVVSGIVTTVGTTGSAGRSIMFVRYALPTAVAAVKV